MARQEGRVKVLENRYKFDGGFHAAYPNTPIRRADGKLVGVTNPRDITHVHSYGGEAVFFESLSKGRLIASRCDNPRCETKGFVYMPFRIHCPDCLARNSHVDMTDIAKRTSRIHTFMVCERSGAFSALPTPIKFINIEFEGVCTILMSYFSVGTPEIGMRVVPIFRTRAPTYTIIDLSWVPEGTESRQLPAGFTF